MSAFKSWVPSITLLAVAANCLAAGEAITNRLVAWDGEKAAKGSGWTNATGHDEVSLRPQTAVAHSGHTALEMRCQGTQWLGAGWNWVAFTKGEGTDVRAMKRLTLRVKCSGKGGDLQINLLCGGQEFDTPESSHGKGASAQILSRAAGWPVAPDGRSAGRFAHRRRV